MREKHNQHHHHHHQQKQQQQQEQQFCTISSGRSSLDISCKLFRTHGITYPNNSKTRYCSPVFSTSVGRGGGGKAIPVGKRRTPFAVQALPISSITVLNIALVEPPAEAACISTVVPLWSWSRSRSKSCK